MSPIPVNPSTPSTLSAASLASLASHFARAVSHVLTTRDEDEDKKCHPAPNINLCEKPNASKPTAGIVVGTIAGLVFGTTVITLIILHIRRQRQDKREFPKNNQELDDYGIGPMAPASTGTPARPQKAYRQPRVEPDAEDDDDLKPPRRRDSLNSLARSIRGNPDAYKSRPDDTSHDMKPVEPVSQL
ncbi:uncharacterized protein F4812DRAFT_448547 [Daldinia caldariorum]|uniref:uncharacterized protein n=1 Tax=Daldinia caldariorum TaxID=326644 RepID=UPI002008E70C|nr:uncharacterized protein F4812DRAFT_448547 [Daldinia caldariorum]KAI1462924.1 hypothetical protein F4812DRAFT_448547 [Daldinia caldariorum]